MKVGKFDVKEHQYAVLECPVCEKPRKVYYLGCAGDRVGWVCGVCTAELLEDPETNDVERVKSTPDSADSQIDESGR